MVGVAYLFETGKYAFATAVVLNWVSTKGKLLIFVFPTHVGNKSFCIYFKVANK